MNKSALPRSLINDDGSSFDSELAEVETGLANLSNEDREVFRNRNAADVAASAGARILVVAGPGAGKSFLFLDRIRYWLTLQPKAEIYVASFVRKLVMDLQGDVESELSKPEQRRVSVSTLHQLARSLLERSRGTTSQPMRPYIRIIAPPWHDVVWDDVLQFEPALDAATYSRAALARQFHSEDFAHDDEWRSLRSVYAQLCQFYNAVGFADMIVLARTAVDENPQLVTQTFWIFDEYQDFNRAEDSLVRAVTASAAGVMLAGDDDQALYQDLKASHPEIIISYYDDPNFANAMLPYCSRCGYHICEAASAFISKYRDDTSIRKVYLPLTVAKREARVRVVGTASPSAAVDYIAKFLEAYQPDLDAHIQRMHEGKESDPFLLILSPDRDVKYFKPDSADDALRTLVDRWSNVSDEHSFDYRRVATYYGAAGDARDNFSLRKVLSYENVLLEDVHRLITEAMTRGCNLADLDDEIVRHAVSKCSEVSAILSAPEIDVTASVEFLAALVDIGDPELLALELGTDPIGTSTTSSEDELSLALPTAGRLSAVALMTMFSSKGLSAQHVIVLGCDEVNMSKTTPLTFFVALTRARRTLHLVTSMKARGETTHSYLADLPAAHCEYRWYTKKSGKPDEVKDLRALAAKFDWLAKQKGRSKG